MDMSGGCERWESVRSHTEKVHLAGEKSDGVRAGRLIAG